MLPSLLHTSSVIVVMVGRLRVRALSELTLLMAEARTCLYESLHLHRDYRVVETVVNASMEGRMGLLESKVIK